MEYGLPSLSRNNQPLSLFMFYKCLILIISPRMSKLRSDFWQTADTLELILALSDEAAGDSWNPRGCPHHWLFLWDRAIGSEGGKLKVVARGGKTRRRVTRTQLREGTPPIGALYTQATTFPVKSRWVDMWTAVLRMKVWFLESQNPPNHHKIDLW